MDRLFNHDQEASGQFYGLLFTMATRLLRSEKAVGAAPHGVFFSTKLVDVS